MYEFAEYAYGSETYEFIKENAEVLSGLVPNLYDTVGLIGVALYVVAYMGVQIGQIDGNRLLYTSLNGVAAGCILFSMLGAFNLAGALVNGLFMIFSVIGALRITVRARRAARETCIDNVLEIDADSRATRLQSRLQSAN
ncbi:MAG: hypothetical protein AAGC81_18390 [Pseudomonadota bacterium]